jgi:hypothetical protein
MLIQSVNEVFLVIRVFALLAAPRNAASIQWTNWSSSQNKRGFLPPSISSDGHAYFKQLAKTGSFYQRLGSFYVLIGTTSMDDNIIRAGR